MGLTCDMVRHGAEAVAAWERRAYDLVLMDIEMPVLDGYEATREIRRRELSAGRGRTPIIALSADAIVETRERARQVGMDEFATKPIEIGRLQGLIARVIGDHEAGTGTERLRA
jgi:CheY-like chemotaxis protein